MRERLRKHNSNQRAFSGGVGDCTIVYENLFIQWQKCIGSTNHELFGSFILTADGGYMLAMSSQGNDGDVSGNHQVNRYHFLQFNARSNGDDVLLNWSIPNNNDCRQFIIERSVDGTSFAGATTAVYRYYN